MGELLDFQKPMVDGVDTADIVDTVDIMVDTVDTLEARGLLMPNLRPKLNPRDLVMLNPRLYLMLNMDTMDIPLPMDTMVDIIPVPMDMDTTDTDILERDLLVPNLNLNTMILAVTNLHIVKVDSLDTTIFEMFDKYLI